MNITNVYNWLINSLSMISGNHCFLCEAPIKPDLKKGLCGDCLADFPFNTNVCVRCGTPLFSTEQLCGNCLKTPPAWHTLVGLCQYEYPIPTIIQALKYHAKFAYAKFLSELFTHRIQAQNISVPQCILPVPLHHSRQKQRGFNQATELARPIAKSLGIELDITSCIRVSNTQAQAQLNLASRLDNLFEAFALRKVPSYKHIAIFDDVVTTGSTVSSLCKLLHQAGVERVDVWCIARASKSTGADTIEI